MDTATFTRNLQHCRFALEMAAGTGDSADSWQSLQGLDSTWSGGLLRSAALRSLPHRS